ncbi:MAG TPA: hypothetical protein VFU69_10560 [Ktedonobacterales bacterium]|nr:hypothetical protein [Ktedonobacterales bacterium]
MFVFGKKRSGSGVKGSGGAPMPRRSPDVTPSAAGPAADRSAVPLAGQRFEAALLVAGLPVGVREAWMRQVLALAAKRPAWQEEDVGEEAAEQCRCWWPLVEERLRQQTPRGLLLTLQTELEGGLRSMATPLWLLNRIVRRVWLLHQGQRVGQVYRALERKLGDGALALAWVCQMVAGLARVGLLVDER